MYFEFKFFLLIISSKFLITSIIYSTIIVHIIILLWKNPKKDVAFLQFRMKLIPKESKTLFLRTSIFFFHTLKSSAMTYKSFQTDIYLFKRVSKKKVRIAAYFIKQILYNWLIWVLYKDSKSFHIKFDAIERVRVTITFYDATSFFKLIWIESNNICWLKSQIWILF